jgi:hypothetical protein
MLWVCRMLLVSDGMVRAIVWGGDMSGGSGKSGFFSMSIQHRGRYKLEGKAPRFTSKPENENANKTALKEHNPSIPDGIV